MCGAAASTHAMVMLLVEMDGVSISSCVDLRHECRAVMDSMFMFMCMRMSLTFKVAGKKEDPCTNGLLYWQ